MALELDLSFGTSGFLIQPPGIITEGAAVDVDGSIVATGFGSSPPKTSQTVRYSADGKAFQVFSNTGAPPTGTPDSFEAADVIIQPDRKIVLVGDDSAVPGPNFNFQVVRYLANGTALDTTFGTNGVVTGPEGFSLCVTLQKDGKIIVGGQAFNDNRLRLVRYNTDGSIDFNTENADVGWRAEDVLLEPDDNILVGAAFFPSGSSTFQVYRYDTNGTLLMTFAPGPVGIATGIALQRDGNVLVGGYNNVNTSAEHFQIARFNGTSGALDATYGASGPGFTIGSAGQANRLLLQSNQEAVVTGEVNAFAFNSPWQLERYTTSGAVSSTFTSVPSGPIGALSGASVQISDELITVGSNSDGTSWQIARFVTDAAGYTPTTITFPFRSTPPLPAGPIVVTGTAECPSLVFILVDGAVVPSAGTSTPLNANTWATIVVLSRGRHTIQAVSIYQNRHLNAASEVVTVRIRPGTATQAPTEVAVGTVSVPFQATPTVGERAHDPHQAIPRLRLAKMLARRQEDEKQ